VFVTFERQNRFSTYAGVQYFILGSFPSARLLLSFALFYLQSGSMAFQDRDLFFNTNYDIVGIQANQDAFKLDYIVNEVEIFSETSLNYLDTEVIQSFFNFFPMEQIEILSASVNPVNARSIRALFFLFFNMFGL
jgi:hypothetical protein